MLEQIQAIKQIFYFQVLVPALQDFCKSTLGAGTPTHPSGSSALPAARTLRRREAQPQAASPCFTLDKAQLPADILTQPAQHCRITSAPLASLFFPLGKWDV